MRDNDALHHLASSQHALVSTSQLHGLGFSRKRIEEGVRRHRLEPVHRGVYRMPGSVNTFEQATLAACLALGGTVAASHRSGAQLWDVDVWGEADLVELSIRETRSHRLPGVTLHRSVDLAESQIVRRRGVPVTTPLRLLVDLGAVLPQPAVANALDDLVGRRIVTVAGVRRTLEQLAARGRSGCGVLREVLDRRTGAELTMGRTRLEGLLIDLCRRSGLGEPEFQYRIRLGGRNRRIDFALPELRIAIEVDGYESHSRFDVFQDDRVRANELELAGWTVLRFTWHQLTQRPDYVLGVLTRAMASAA